MNNWAVLLSAMQYTVLFSLLYWSRKVLKLNKRIKLFALHHACSLLNVAKLNVVSPFSVSLTTLVYTVFNVNVFVTVTVTSVRLTIEKGRANLG